MVTGRQNASKTPVTAALRSFMLVFFFAARVHMYSARIHEITHTAVTASALMPKKYTEPARAGSMAISTSRIVVEI